MNDHCAVVKAGGLWCPLCYSGVRGRRGFSGHLGASCGAPQRRVQCAMTLKKRPAVPEGSPLAAAAAGGVFADYWPHVVEFVSSCSWAEGEVRVPGTVLLCTNEGRWALWAHDKDGGASLWVSGETLDDALSSLEGHLEAGTGDWRRDKPRPPGKRG